MYFTSPYFHHSMSPYPMIFGVMHPNEGAFDNGTRVCGNTKNEIISKRSITYDTVDSGSDLKIFLDLPGVKVSDVTVNIEKPNIITVNAFRSVKNDEEITFEQKLLVNKKIAKVSNTKAVLENGVLTLLLEKTKPTEPTTIEVKTSDVDLVEESTKDANHFVWTHDLPGVKLNDVKVTYHEDHVSISATRKRGDNSTKIVKKISLLEEKYNVQSIKAYLVDGVLTITAPPTDNDKKNDVTVATDGAENVMTTIPVMTKSANNANTTNKPTNETNAVAVHPIDDSVIVNH